MKTSSVMIVPIECSWILAKQMIWKVCVQSIFITCL